VPKMKLVSCVFRYPYEKIGKIWTSGRSPIGISKCGCLKILINKKMSGPLFSLWCRLNSAQTLASRARNSCSATTSRRCCRPAATSAPCATYAAAAPCVISSCYRSEREVVLSSSHNSRRTPTHSAMSLVVCLYSFIAMLLCSKHRIADHRALLSCASEPRQASRRATVHLKEPLKHRAGHLLHLPRPPSHRVPPPATDVILHHRSNLHPSSPPLHEPRAGALHLFSGPPSLVPHRRPASPLRAHHGEPLCCLCTKSGPSPPRLAPWHLLQRPLAAGRPNLVPGRKAQVGQAAFTGWAKRHSGCSPLQ
jgi:hypothetical protein